MLIELNLYLFHHLINLILSKYYRFHDKILPWQPQMHGQPLYNSQLTLRFSRWDPSYLGVRDDLTDSSLSVNGGISVREATATSHLVCGGITAGCDFAVSSQLVRS